MAEYAPRESPYEQTRRLRAELNTLRAALQAATAERDALRELLAWAVPLLYRGPDYSRIAEIEALLAVKHE